MQTRREVGLYKVKFTILLVFIMGLVSLYGCGEKVKKQSQEDIEEVGSRDVTAEKKAKKVIVEKGDTVKVQYIGRLQNGTVFDKSPDDNPLEFIVGESRLISGFHKAVEGMRLNEEKEVLIKAQDAYGQRYEKLVREFPRESLPKNIEPQKGMVMKLQDQTGRSIPGIITDINETTVTIDLNHPLAGNDLIFNIKVVSIE